MKVLMVNKFLHPNGGSETYIFKLGACLRSHGHEVQYFGMDHPDRVVGNQAEAYTSNMDFHGGSGLEKVTYPIKTIYSAEARRKIRLVLDSFQPDVCHLNNFNYQLTPSIILEVRKWERQTRHPCRIVYTAHDYQLVCPNHMCCNPLTHKNCEKCLDGWFMSCVKGRCIHGSLAKSVIGALEATFWKWMGVYKHIDTMICCSNFMKTKLDTNPVFEGKTIVMHNFIDPVEKKQVQKKDYILYFGRYSREKGIATLVQAAKELPEIPFVFAGSGPLEHLLKDVPNITNVGFQTGEMLETLIREARFTVYPSEWYENCPFSVMESQMYGTPVLGADIGGIPELIREGENGELFESGNVKSLINMIRSGWQNKELMGCCSCHCEKNYFDSAEQYIHNLIKNIYSSEK